MKSLPLEQRPQSHPILEHISLILALAMQTSSPDVLVVGAGPVGLTTAAELARHGVRCRIIDHLVTPLPYCRAIGVSPRTLEVWDDMGIA
jgi:NADPH-dependent 2,4-dienoyl-CoA reductase/sulfur reductase-like enzyme